MATDHDAQTDDEPRLVVDLVGERHEIGPDEAFTFGRAGDLVVDDANPYLHRILGRFTWHDGWWWLENLGSQVELELIGHDGTIVKLPPTAPDAGGVSVPLTTTAYRLRFEAGGLRYEIELEVSGGAGPGQIVVDDLTGETTTPYGVVQLTDDERLLVAALAEPVLRDPSAGPEALPANRAIAARLDWGITKFNRKLDYLCTRLTRSGVRGLQGGRGEEATNRRWRLVEHAIAARLVSVEDLDVLPPA